MAPIIPEKEAIKERRSISQVGWRSGCLALPPLHALSAPRNLITAIQRLRGIRLECPVVATIAQLKRESHLTILSSKLVISALFDTKLTGGER